MTEPKWIHLTARMSLAAPELSREDTGGWLWQHLRTTFPDAIAAVLMPDHPHLVIPTFEPSRAADRFARSLGHFGRRFTPGWPAARVAAPQVIRGGNVLARQVRYVALNPCRAQLVSCPLAWPWSTHRDVIGACVDPWVDAARLAKMLEVPAMGFAARHHAYVSGDPHARVEGTPMPRTAKSTAVSQVTMSTILVAVAAACRAPISAIRERGRVRGLFVALALDQGWSERWRLAEACGCSQRAIDSHAANIDRKALVAARLCLGDARLRRLPESTRSTRTHRTAV